MMTICSNYIPGTYCSVDTNFSTMSISSSSSVTSLSLSSFTSSCLKIDLLLVLAGDSRKREKEREREREREGVSHVYIIKTTLLLCTPMSSVRALLVSSRYNFLASLWNTYTPNTGILYYM